MSGIEQSIGKKIRRARLARKLTLADVAGKVGLSTGMISKIENGKSSSPISTYYRLAQALDIRPGDLFADDTGPDCFVIRRDDPRPRSRKRRGLGHTFESLGFRAAQKKMEPFLITLYPNHPVPRFVHTADEFFYVLKGQVEFFHRDKRFLLSRGDAIYFDGRVPHGGRAHGSRPAQVLSIASND
jgi:transcriptional regulator with XRE-family HTH domain